MVSIDGTIVRPADLFGGQPVRRATGEADVRATIWEPNLRASMQAQYARNVSEPTGPSVNAGVRVLVVEDYRPLADLLAEGLCDDGMATEVAYDGTEAASKLDHHAYDVVVLDRALPGIHGDALCRMIARKADGRAMVLMLSGSESPTDREDGLSLGADDYLVKPFHFPELVLRVRALARRQPSARPVVLRAAGIELDCVSRTVRRGGRPVELSTKELAVLEALMVAGPAYLSAEQLLDQVWDENADPFTKIVTVTIGRLRHKLGGPDVIVTVPRVGYRIVPVSPATPTTPSTTGCSAA
jgi:DNA-binding response OmpR family regulator